jgi:hypothetical protein
MRVVYIYILLYMVILYDRRVLKTKVLKALRSRPSKSAIHLPLFHPFV